MKKISFTLMIILVLSATALAALNLIDFPDELITFDEILILRGQGKDLASLMINSQLIKFNAKDGTFNCGAALKPGKNLIRIQARDTSNLPIEIRRRVLRLKSFDDLEILYNGQPHWAKQPIINLSTLGLIEGYPDNNYYPSQPVTRAEFATWLVRVRDLPRPKKIEQDVMFDVPKEHWRAPYIKAALEAGLVKSESPELFGIDEPITRREVAALAVKFEGLGETADLKPIFVDVLKEEEEAGNINLAGQTGLVKGVFENISIYDPDRPLTRAEAAVLLSRFNKSIDDIERLFDFKSGYSEEKFCRLNLAPEILSFIVKPERTSLREKTSLRLEAAIAPRTGFYELAKVKVDLSEINGPSEAEMKDDGQAGDAAAGDLTYSLSIAFEPKETGSKLMVVTAIDQLGWEGKKQAFLRID